MTEDLKLSDKDMCELHYLIGRLIGLRERVGYDIDASIYHDSYRVKIEKKPPFPGRVVP